MNKLTAALLLSASPLTTAALLVLSAQAYGASPEWTAHQDRAVVGGDILHWGTGMGATAEKARFMAETMASRNVVSECGRAHADIHVWDRHVEVAQDGTYRAYARAGIPFSSCEEAKAGGGKLNPQLAQDIETLDRIERGIRPRALEELSEWAHDAVSKQRDAQTKDHRKINEIANRMQQLEEQGPTVVTSVIQSRDPAAARSQRRCVQEYEMLMQRAQAAAGEHEGNLADPDVEPLYEAAQAKQRECAGQ